jgi:hypothetical protein
LVTGANRGIGAEIARRLNEFGAVVYAGARDPEAVENPSLRPVELDVTEEGGIAAAIDRIAAKTDRLDVLVNNAGVYGPTGQVENIEPSDAEQTLQTNLHGPIRVCRHALPVLTETPGAHIINISSRSGQFDNGIESKSVPYGVSKAGLNAFTMALAKQYPDLLVNAVCPGPTQTDMVGSSAPRTVAEGATTPVWLARFGQGSPSGRLWMDKEPIGW